ncbi:MAG: phage tail protein [Chloroflexi bacterium]|nr:phage tail protein [Chloroflexota bacterium]OJV92837.1 MAG: phage tail protein [Chloroflexi bacterium 54-19]
MANNPGVFTDPYRAYNFKLVIQGVTEGHFTECSGLGIRVQAIKYREGGINQVVHAIPGFVEYSDVTLKYGLTNSAELWNWFMTVVKGKVTRKNVSILLLDSDGATEVMRWDLINAWPSEWRGVPLDAMHREVALETLTLVFETLERA